MFLCVVSFAHKKSTWALNILGTRIRTSCLSSATRPSGCSARPHRTRSWPYPTTWTIPRRFWWPIGCVSVRFWTFCCLWRRSRRVRELPPLSIPKPRPSRPGRRHQREWRICQPWGICSFDRRGQKEKRERERGVFTRQRIENHHHHHPDHRRKKPQRIHFFLKMIKRNTKESQTVCGLKKKIHKRTRTWRYGRPGIGGQPSRIARRLSWRIYLYHVQTWFDDWDYDIRFQKMTRNKKARKFFEFFFTHWWNPRLENTPNFANSLFLLLRIYLPGSTFCASSFETAFAFQTRPFV